MIMGPTWGQPFEAAAGLLPGVPPGGNVGRAAHWRSRFGNVVCQLCALFLAEYPKPNQENGTEDHHHHAGIEQKYEPASRVESFESRSYLGAPPEVGNPLGLRRPFVYLAYHHERNHIRKNGNGCHQATSKDDRQ